MRNLPAGVVLPRVPPGYLESLYEKFLSNPWSVPAEWRAFFEGFQLALQEGGEPSRGTALTPETLSRELRIWQWIDLFRRYGHLEAHLDPLGRKRSAHHPVPPVSLHPESAGLSPEDLEQLSYVAQSFPGKPKTGKDLEPILRNIYCQHIGFEYMHISDPVRREWLRKRIEQDWATWEPPYELREKIITLLNHAEVLEQFLNTKYLGQKRFSIEGADVLIPALELTVEKSVQEHRVREIIIGMAHRGRINVLANVLRKTYEEIFMEFEDVLPNLPMGDGDVKYHRGYYSTRKFGEREVTIRLLPNPSHLESVNPVVQGYARGLIDYLRRREKLTHSPEEAWKEILPILIHGDAALTGQGVVYEAVQMMRLTPYYTGGILHMVVNNQIGFTVPPREGRSTWYPTGVANMVEVPVFHVNGDFPEAVIFAVFLALEYRFRFGEDAWVDIWGYRKYGHNEGDDPSYTQPVMYTLVRKHPGVREQYLRYLEQLGARTRQLAEQKKREFWKQLQSAFREVRQKPRPYIPQEQDREWKTIRRTFQETDLLQPVSTGISRDFARFLLDQLTTLPPGVTPLPKVEKLFHQQRTRYLDKEILDWAGAELLAYASLAGEGYSVRLSGEDSKRGTFSHRHAIIVDRHTEKEVSRFHFLQDPEIQQRILALRNGEERLRQPHIGTVEIWNSHLSEFAALGFEYGYSLVSPFTLVIWEAQFGDFANGGQVIIDQYITSGEDKWAQCSGLVLFLPHGYEGQGPEHSSGRMERFLQLAADASIYVVNCTTPANFFHVLRRQMHSPYRKPLILFTPKSLLRHPRAISPLTAFTEGSFQPILDDHDLTVPPGEVRRLLLCSGKIYYDLIGYREQHKIPDIAIIRLEQLYPLDTQRLLSLLKKYESAREWVWVQEEPENMGAWHHLRTTPTLPREIQQNLRVICRAASASPASGFHHVDREEQKQIIEKAFSPESLPERTVVFVPRTSGASAPSSETT